MTELHTSTVSYTYEFNPTFEVQKMESKAFQNFQTGMRETVVSELHLLVMQQVKTLNTRE